MDRCRQNPEVKEEITDSTFKQTLNSEILAYCSDCRMKITSYLSDIIDFNIEHQALKVKKCLIQYFYHSDDYLLFFLLSILIPIYWTRLIEKMSIQF